MSTAIRLLSNVFKLLRIDFTSKNFYQLSVSGSLYDTLMLNLRKLGFNIYTNSKMLATATKNDTILLIAAAPGELSIVDKTETIKLVKSCLDQLDIVYTTGISNASMQANRYEIRFSKLHSNLLAEFLDKLKSNNIKVSESINTIVLRHQPVSGVRINATLDLSQHNKSVIIF